MHSLSDLLCIGLSVARSWTSYRKPIQAQEEHSHINFLNMPGSVHGPGLSQSLVERQGTLKNCFYCQTSEVNPEAEAGTEQTFLSAGSSTSFRSCPIHLEYCFWFDRKKKQQQKNILNNYFRVQYLVVSVVCMPILYCKYIFFYVQLFHALNKGHGTP